ncbi:PREDICTED: titin-like isoform X2 [Nicrophorus vespilloides]|uniref:Titin-like isoform X2 n=1 Tax=Nicrophorus vespilloides TaxID=110193 RepID=A0ABM1MME8_NICVS|nr:PREDICTED: titin-like isoform X2 [Nicrophorus vespilloides]
MPGYKKSKQKRRPRKKPQAAEKKDVNTQKPKAKPEDISTASTPEMKLHDIDERQHSTWYATTDGSAMAATSSDVQRESSEAMNPDDDEYKQDALSEISDFSTRSSEFEVLWKKYQTGDEAAPNESKQGKEAKFGYESSDGAAGFVEMRRSKKYFDETTPVLGPMAEAEESPIKAEDSPNEDPEKVMELMMPAKKVGHYSLTNIGKENAQKTHSIAPSGDIERPVGGTSRQMIPKTKALKDSKNDEGPKNTYNPEDKLQDKLKCLEKTDNTNDVAKKSSGAIAKKIDETSDNTNTCKKKKKSNKKKKTAPLIEVKFESTEAVNPKDDKQKSLLETSDICTHSSEDKEKPSAEVAASNKNKQDETEKAFAEMSCAKKHSEDSQDVSSTSSTQELIGESQEQADATEYPPIGDPRKLIKWVISGQKLACTFKLSSYAPRTFDEKDSTVKEDTSNIENSTSTEDSSTGATSSIKETALNDETNKENPSEDTNEDNGQQTVYSPEDRAEEQNEMKEEFTNTNDGVGEVKKKSTENANEVKSCKKKKSDKKSKSGSINPGTDKLKSEALTGMSDTSKKYQIEEADESNQIKQGNGSESSDIAVNGEQRCAKKYSNDTEEIQCKTSSPDPVSEVAGSQGSAVPSPVSSNNDPTEDSEESSRPKNIKQTTPNQQLNLSESSKGDNREETVQQPADKENKKKSPKTKSYHEVVTKLDNGSSLKINKKCYKKKKSLPITEVQKDSEVNMSKKDDLFKKHQTDDKVIPSKNKEENDEKLVSESSDATGITEMECDKKIFKDTKDAQSAITEPKSKVAESPDNEESDEEYHYNDPEKVTTDDVALEHSDEEEKKLEEEIFKSMFDVKTCKKKKCHKKNKRLIRELKKVDLEATKLTCKKQDSQPEGDPALLSQNKQGDDAGSSDGAGVDELAFAKEHSNDPQHTEFTARDPTAEDAESSGNSEPDEELTDTSIEAPKMIIQQTFLDNFKIDQHVSNIIVNYNKQIVTPTAKSEIHINQSTSNEEPNPPKEDNKRDIAYNSEDKGEEQTESKEESDNTNDKASKNCEEVSKENNQGTKDFFTVKSCKSMKKWCKKKKNALRSPIGMDAQPSNIAVEKPIKKSEKTEVNTSVSKKKKKKKTAKKSPIDIDAQNYISVVEKSENTDEDTSVSNTSMTERPGTSTEIYTEKTDEFASKNRKLSPNVYIPPPSDIKPLIIHVSSSCSFSTSTTSSSSPTSNTKVVNLQHIKKQLLKIPASRKNKKPKRHNTASTSNDHPLDVKNGAVTIQRFKIVGIPREYCTPSYISKILKTREFGMNFSKPTEELLVRGNSVFIKTADRTLGAKINNFGNVIGYPVKISKVAEYKIPDIHFSCVIRGVHKSISAEEIYNVLRGDNFKINRVCRIISSKTGNITRFIRVIAYNKRTIEDLIKYGVKIFGELYRCEPSNTPVKKQQKPKTPDPIPEMPTLSAQISTDPTGNKEIMRNMTMALIDKIPPNTKSFLLKLENDGKRIQIGIADAPLVLDPKEWPTLR